MNSWPSDFRPVTVGIGQLAVTADPKVVLVAHGLGSCVGLSVHDDVSGVAGLVHVLLPESEGRVPGEKEPARFGDCAIPALLNAVTKAGADRRKLVFKIAGGAAVLGSANNSRFKIGERNVEAVKRYLKEAGFRCAAEEVGGTSGRTMEVYGGPAGKVLVRTATSEAKEL